MNKLFKRLFLSIVIMGAFYLAGQLGIFIENHYHGVIAGTIAFGLSFVALIGSAIKAWPNIF